MMYKIEVGTFLHRQKL